jgi:HAD superfamily hydrolase (TIGR01484 family)
MEFFNPQAGIRPSVLATDLDGTLIPLEGDPRNVEDLGTLGARFEHSDQTLVFATGRSFDSAMDAIRGIPLPDPDWIVCDVGSRIMHREGAGWQAMAAYDAHLSEITAGLSRADVEAALDGIDGLTLQVPEHQTQVKISYQCQGPHLEPILAEVASRIGGMPFTGMGSIDPFQNLGLIDVMPGPVSKAYALIWLATHADYRPDEVVYAGDSGNDLAALAAGFRAIVVANAGPGLADQVAALQKERAIPADRLYRAKTTASSGVLEGCRYFGLLD